MQNSEKLELLEDAIELLNHAAGLEGHMHESFDVGIKKIKLVIKEIRAE